MNTSDSTPIAVSPKPKRWPIALLVALITGIASAALTMPVADWAMEAHHVSNFEGGRAYGIVCLFMPLAFVVGFAVGFAVSLLIKRSGFAGYALCQGLALLIMAALITGIGGLAYASADHPPLVDGKRLALEIEVRVPTKNRSIEDLIAQDLRVALTVSASDRSYSDLRWNLASRTEEYITVPAWASLNSKNAGRDISVSVGGEKGQLFNVLLRASPNVAEEWSEWMKPRERFDQSKVPPADEYLVRYRVRFEAEYSPTPTPIPTPPPPPTPVESPVPEASPAPDA